MITGIVFVWVLRGVKRDERRLRAGKAAKVCPDCAEPVKADGRICRPMSRECGGGMRRCRDVAHSCPI
jgi:hypothetical protein